MKMCIQIRAIQKIKKKSELDRDGRWDAKTQDELHYDQEESRIPSDGTLIIVITSISSLPEVLL
jgi:hypothetical protein